MKGVDYSYSKPNLTCLKQNGIKFVVRYIGSGSSAKYITRAEADDILGRGIALVLVYQTAKDFMLNGHMAGVTAGHVARDYAQRMGQPSDRPIYFALDFDPSTLDGTGIGKVEAFLAGASSVLGRNRVGLYGGYRAIELFCPIHAKWGWQTYAWSRGQWSSKAQLRQVKNNVAFCGGYVDHDESVATDFGQWPAPVSTKHPEVIVDPTVLICDGKPPRVISGGHNFGFRDEHQWASWQLAMASTQTKVAYWKVSSSQFDYMLSVYPGK